MCVHTAPACNNTVWKCGGQRKSARPPSSANSSMAPSSQGTYVSWVFVLGDFGRSPRMQYHTQSLATCPNSTVYVIAYGGAAPLPALTANPSVHITVLPEVPAVIQMLPGIFRLAFKVLHQLLALAWIMLVQLPSPSNILMQNPPAIPSMMLCWLAAKRHGAKLIIDWHNFAYTIMALKHSSSGLLVRLARSHELAWGKAAHKHFCVTQAMRMELQQRWGIPATVLYDRPPQQFQRSNSCIAHELFVRLAPSLAGQGYRDFAAIEAPTWDHRRTVITSCTRSPSKAISGGSNLEPAWRSDRPAVVVSSTSWTPDEDFGILLEALVLYEQAMAADSASTSQALPPLLVLITGRGPQRAMYLKRIEELQLRGVAVRSLWLEAQDYPLLLGAADLGVSLHASSSGLDLPMKVVDMFGSGLPVCAVAYNCIHELVEDGETGLLFSTPQQLCEQLQQLLQGFPTLVTKRLKHMQQRVASKEQGLRWEDNWKNVAWPLISEQ